MIKNNDTATVIILSLVAFVALTYSMMFIYQPNAEAFIDRLGPDALAQRRWLFLDGINWHNIPCACHW